MISSCVPALSILIWFCIQLMLASVHSGFDPLPLDSKLSFQALIQDFQPVPCAFLDSAVSTGGS